MITEEEFIAQYEEHAASLVRYMVYRFGTSRAEDIAATAWQKAWEHRDQFAARNGCTFKSYLTKIAINAAYEEDRRDRNRDYLMSITLPQVVHDSNVVERGIIAADSLRDIRKRMTEKQTELFTMRFIHGMSIEDIGGATHINMSTVKTMLRRTRLSLSR